MTISWNIYLKAEVLHKFGYLGRKTNITEHVIQFRSSQHWAYLWIVLKSVIVSAVTLPLY